VPFPPYPSVPNPSTWSAGPILTSRLRDDVAGAVNFLANRPLFVGQATEGVSIPNNADTLIALTSEVVDTWGGHATIGGSGAVWQWYYCQAPGWYLAEGYTPFDYITATQACFAAGLVTVKSGVTEPVVRGQLQLVGSGYHPGPKLADLIPMSVTGPVGGTGDAVQLTCLQTTGSSQFLTNGPASLYPFLAVRWVAALTGTAGLNVPANPSWPVPPSYITSAGYLNPAIRDTIRFLTYPPICKAYYSGSASIPSQTFPAGTVVNLNAVTVDNYSGFTTGASGGYTVPAGGLYYLYGQVNYATDSSGAAAYSAGLRVNGGTIQWGDSVYKTTSESTGGGATVRKRLRLNAGDFVQFMAQQSSGSTLSLNGTSNNQSRFIAVWESS
jgi:hypothetical protein